MSENLSPLPPVGERRLRSGWFFGGLAVGLAALGFLGRRAGQTDYHPGFVRLSTPITPEANYYPTVDELCAVARSKCRPDQVLVVVGGNSVLEGVWQPAAEVWTRALQADLGPAYGVVNLAFRGSCPTDGGAVVSEVLRKEYPRQVYIANDSPATAVDSIGSDAYRFLFWQAYFSGRLVHVPMRERRVRDYLLFPSRRSEAAEILIRETADRALRFHDLWNRVGYGHFFTVPSLYGSAFPQMLTPRCEFPDLEPDATDPSQVAFRYPESSEAMELKIIRNLSGLAYGRAPDGRWEMLPGRRADLIRTFAEAFPDPLKGRTLILISRSSPHYRAMLTADESARDDQAFKDSVALWREAGCHSIEYGRDFGEDDFGDRTHLSKLGGRKLADLVANEVRAIAAQRGYLK